jgi:cytochrome c oxidase accessory protein FixG
MSSTRAARPVQARPDLYVRRKDIFPKAVDGFYRRLKWIVMAVTLAVYWITPWIRWDRGPYAPNQAVLVDLAHRRFYWFSIEIWPHEFYYVAGLLVMAGIGLFLLTATVGRAWCGYACPQTVWTDIFLHVERWIDGDRNAQIKLRAAPIGPAKIAKRVAKHGIWLFIGFMTGGAWCFYFTDAPTLGKGLFDGTAPAIAWTTIAILTATTYIFGGWMREQVCIYMCPWPRIQGAMLDEKSLIVTYKEWRGEPRTHGLKRSVEENAGAPIGDCIDCSACVQVCPTGIDIRNGPQLACITCALCIDACDAVMAKIDRPRGLIDYATFEGSAAERQGAAPLPLHKTLLRSRTLIYFGLWAAIGVAMLASLGGRVRLDLSVAQERNPQFIQLSDGSVRNAYTIKIRNMEDRPRAVRLRIEGLSGATMWDSMQDEHEGGTRLDFTVAADQVEKHRIYVRAPRTGAAPATFAFRVDSRDGRPATDHETARFDRPEAGQ